MESVALKLELELVLVSVLLLEAVVELFMESLEWGNKLHHMMKLFSFELAFDKLLKSLNDKKCLSNDKKSTMKRQKMSFERQKNIGGKDKINIQIHDFLLMSEQIFCSR